MNSTNPSGGDRYVDAVTLKLALGRLYGTAGHLLKLWFTLKHMGLGLGRDAVEIDTANSTTSLRRLYSFGQPDGNFYVPFAHTPRYATMKHDASRSIVQTNIQRWASSGSVVTCDPTTFLDISNVDNKLQVAPGRRYPMGLGSGESGFALADGKRVAVPLVSFAVWYGRTSRIPNDAEPSKYLVDKMLEELNISSPEKSVIFVDDDLEIQTQPISLTDADIYAECKPFIDGYRDPIFEIKDENPIDYARRVRSMISGLELPAWMRTPPAKELQDLIAAGASSILLYGPPRTGKTRIIDSIVARDSAERCSIQIHDGWGYDHLIEGFRPDQEGNWDWADGPLKEAVENGKKYIVLEEVNRTDISQALGEVFSLIEESYRGVENGILLRSGKKFFIPAGVVFLMTMNTIAKSTEEVDDALMGRVAAVEFPPRQEDLLAMLVSNGVPEAMRDKILLLYAEILSIYPLGHGYFAQIKPDINDNSFLAHYKARVRPVLFNHLGVLKKQELSKIDNVVDGLFSKA